MRLSHTDPRDVEFVAAVLASADLFGSDVWDQLTPVARQPYLVMSDAALRGIEIGEERK